MNKLPDKIWVRRSDVRDYLGVSEAAITKMIRSGTLKPKVFFGMTWAYFERSEVLQIKPEVKNGITTDGHG